METPLLTAELVVDGAVPRQPGMSPDGRWVAYVVAPVGQAEEQRRSALWIAAADGSSPPRQLTTGTAADCDPRWAPDSASRFFLSDRTGSGRLHRIRVDGGEAEGLTDWRGDIYDHYPLADGRVALRLLDPATRELTAVGDLGGRHVVELAQRPDGGPVAVISWVSRENDPGAITSELHVVDLATGAVLDLGQVAGHAQCPAWWADDGSWHLTYLAEPDPFGGRAEPVRSRARAGHLPAGKDTGWPSATISATCCCAPGRGSTGG